MTGHDHTWIILVREHLSLAKGPEFRLAYCPQLQVLNHQVLNHHFSKFDYSSPT